MFYVIYMHFKVFWFFVFRLRILHNTLGPQCPPSSPDYPTETVETILAVFSSQCVVESKTQHLHNVWSLVSDVFVFSFLPSLSLSRTLRL
jgi:hypothetical protein